MRLRDDSRCNAALTADPYLSDVVRCKRCGTEWNRRKGEWWTLAAQQAEWEEAA